MDISTFTEYFSSPGKFTSQPAVPLQAYTPASKIEDPYCYGVLCRQLAYNFLINWEAAGIVENRVFKQAVALLKKENLEITDDDIWQRKGQWTGLAKLTEDISFEVLIDPSMDRILAQQKIYQKSIVPPAPPEWWETLVPMLRSESLNLYKVAVLMLCFGKSNSTEIGKLLNIPTEDTDKLQSVARNRILESSEQYFASEKQRLRQAENFVFERMKMAGGPQS